MSDVPSEADPFETDQPVLHALLVCRGVETGESGEISIHNVVEILPVEKVPTEVGPVTFLAMVRNLPQGPSKGAFLLGSQGSEQPLARLPFEAEVPAGYDGRQLAMQITVPKLPVATAGWFEVAFEWDGTVLGANRFAVGLMSGGSE